MEVVGLDQDYGQAELEDAGSPGLRYSHCSVDGRTWIMALLYKKKKKKGSVRASPVAAPMPKSVLF